MSTKTQGDTGLLEREEIQKAPPPKLYNVVMINDDFTPMDFVIHVLTDVFNKNTETATVIMLEVHQKGEGVAGTYIKDIAVAKKDKAMEWADKAGHPFKLVVKPQ